MARYTGPKSKIARKFREPIFGPDKVLREKKTIHQVMHGAWLKERRKQSEYGNSVTRKTES
jgi:small subunit ribosomal protein S4